MLNRKIKNKCIIAPGGPGDAKKNVPENEAKIKTPEKNTEKTNLLFFFETIIDKDIVEVPGGIPVNKKERRCSC